jgi:hypothetical protein
MGKPRRVIFKKEDKENSNLRSNSRTRQSKPEQNTEVVGSNGSGGVDESGRWYEQRRNGIRYGF